MIDLVSNFVSDWVFDMVNHDAISCDGWKAGGEAGPELGLTLETNLKTKCVRRPTSSNYVFRGVSLALLKND